MPLASKLSRNNCARADVRFWPMATLNYQKCGRPLMSETCERCANEVVFHIVQREVVLLSLCAMVIPLFVFTRSMAAHLNAYKIVPFSALVHSSRAVRNFQPASTVAVSKLLESTLQS